MQGLAKYLKERFPLEVTIPYSLASAALLVSATINSANHLLTLLLAGCILFFILRMRVSDEFKDSKHDDKNYPGRPVQRGIISKKQLIVVGLISFALEITFAYAAGLAVNNPVSAIWYLAVIGFSVLTRFEFFIPKFLEKHFNLYFLSHQAIFLLYPIWLLGIFGVELNTQRVAGYAAFILAMASMEIMRKYEIRRDPEGNIVLDTYLAVWKSFAFWILLALSASTSALLYLSSMQPVLAIIGLLTFLAMLYFRSKSESIRIIVAITFLAQAGLSYFL